MLVENEIKYVMIKGEEVSHMVKFLLKYKNELSLSHTVVC